MSIPRSWRTGADLIPEEQAKLEAIRARRRTPEARAEEEAVRAAVELEFPPLQPDAETFAVVAELRRERERQGLSLDEIAARSGLPCAALGGLEEGRIPSPTLALLKGYATALGRRFRMTLIEEVPSEPVHPGR